MKIGICDDQKKDRELLKEYCQNLGYSDIVLYPSGETLLDSPVLSTLNLLFLDIELSGMDGINIKNKLETANPSTFIVFITTHQELMPDAFGRNVILFLSKPFSKRSIERCIKKAAYLTKEFYPIIIDEKNAIICKDIVYLHTEHKYTVFHTVNGKTYSSRTSLKEWANRLDALGFCPVSRSAIINLKYYKIIKEKQVLLYDDTSIPVSRRYLQLVESKYNSYMMHLIQG